MNIIKRNNWEQEALIAFENVSVKHSYKSFRGQGRDNQIFLEGRSNYQFGDLRVDTMTHHVVVEIESAGGVTNLVKYWYCLTDKDLSTQISKHIILIHLFRQKSPHDYESHLKLWNFLWNEMQQVLSDRIVAYQFPYNNLAELEPAVKIFEKSLTSL
jgi:hypothetical protein